MTLTEPDTGLTVEERQKIRSLHVGGFGPVGAMRAYHRALDKILPSVRFALIDMRDPHSRPGRPSAAANHRKAHTRCRLYRGVAFAVVEALTQFQTEDRNARRREQRATQTATRNLRAIGAHDDAQRLAERAQLKALAQREGDNTRRAHSKFVLDALALNLRTLLEHHTRLRGDRRTEKIGEIFAALNLGSPEPAAVRQRFRRIPSEMTAEAARKPITRTS